MSKTNIRKYKKGASNFRLYSQLHKQNDLGALYYFNLIYLFLLVAFFIAFVFSWIPLLKIPIIVNGLLLGITSIHVFALSLVYKNIECFGRPFALFRVVREHNGKNRYFATALDWLFPFIPLVLYVFVLLN